MNVTTMEYNRSEYSSYPAMGLGDLILKLLDEQNSSSKILNDKYKAQDYDLRKRSALPLDNPGSDITIFIAVAVPVLVLLVCIIIFCCCHSKFQTQADNELPTGVTTINDSIPTPPPAYPDDKPPTYDEALKSTSSLIAK